MATGLGKTVVFAEIAKRVFRKTQKPVLVLAHRSELIEQAAATLESFGLDCSTEQAESRVSFLENHNVITASVSSLSQTDRLNQFPKDYFSLIITDECHHAPMPSYRNIYTYFAGTKHLGVTATPLRSDKIGLRNIYQSVAFQYDIAKGIEAGFLCEIKGKQIKVEGLELEKINLSSGDFSKTELDGMLMRDKILQRMVLPTLEHAGNRPTIVFTQSVAHAKAITDAFNRATAGKDIAVSVDGKTDALVRRSRIESFKRGEVQFIVNVGVLTEGFDHPPTACIALFRPTKSLSLLAQMIGRGTRLADGKTDCLVLDFVGVNNTVKTVNVLDVLDGTVLTDAEKKRAQKLVDEGEDAKTALEKAKTEIAKLEALQIKWKAISSSNAFDILKLFGIPSAKGLYGGGLATFAQRSLLELKGLKVPPSMEKAEANLLITEIIRRDTAGLATLKQLRYLKKLGYKDFDIESLTREDAGRMIGAGQNSYQRRRVYV